MVKILVISKKKSRSLGAGYFLYFLFKIRYKASRPVVVVPEIKIIISKCQSCTVHLVLLYKKRSYLLGKTFKCICSIYTYQFLLLPLWIIEIPEIIKVSTECFHLKKNQLFPCCLHQMYELFLILQI